jgi:hypothetical protein
MMLDGFWIGLMNADVSDIQRYGPHGLAFYTQTCGCQHSIPYKKHISSEEIL